MRDAIGPMPRDLEQIGGDYGDFIVAMFERLCTDDGTIAIEDQKAFEARRAMKVRALENQLRRRTTSARGRPNCILRMNWAEAATF